MDEIKILCVDDEINVLRSLKRLLLDEDYTILATQSPEEALKILEKESCQIVISDYRMPGMSGVDFLHEVYKQWPETVRLVLSGYADAGTIVSAINEGQIYKFIPKPWNNDELKVTIANAIEKYNLQKENQSLTSQIIEKNKELEELNKTLEKRVEEKTADLAFQNRVLSIAQNILDALPLGIVGIDKDRTIVQTNQFANNLFAGCVKGLLGEKAGTVLPQQEAAIIETAIKQGKAIASMQNNGFSGTVICVPLPQKNNQDGCILIFNPQSNCLTG